MTLKYPIFLLLLLLATLSLQAQRKPKIKGNRQPVTVQESLPDFRAIRLLDDLEISLEAATTPGYAITADDNLIDILKFEVTGDTLFISSFYTVTAKKQLEIKVIYTELQAIRLDAGSLITPAPIQSDGLKMRVTGLARTQFHARGPFVEILMEEQGEGDFHLETDSVRISVGGKAEARVYQQGTSMAVHMRDDSDALLEGMAEALEVDMDGSAELKASKFEAARVTLGMRGTSHAHVRASEGFKLDSEGSANSYLYGDPEISVIRFGGSSELYKREE